MQNVVFTGTDKNRLGGLDVIHFGEDEIVLHRDNHNIAWCVVVTMTGKKRSAPSVGVPIQKIESNMYAAWRFRIPFLLIVKWEDGLGTLVVTKHLWDSRVKNGILQFPVEEFIRVKA